MATLTLTIKIPPDTGARSSSLRSPTYISTDIQSVAFRLTAVTPSGGTFTGTLPSDTLVPITYNTGNCTLVASVETCIATTTAPAPATDVFTIYTYATTSPTIGTTTPLSVYAGYSIAVTVAGPNTASVATWGVPATLAFSPASVSNVPNNSTAALTTSVQVVDAGGATLIGGDNFSNATGTASPVLFTGCDTHLASTPASFSAANPNALGSGAINIVYDGTLSSATTLHCAASANGGLLTAQYAVGVTVGTGSIGWTVTSKGRR